MLKRLLHSALILLASLAPAAAYETKARAAWVYDLTTQTVLLEKDADVPLPPASMSKLMTLNMLFEALRAGTVSMDTQFSVSTKAKSMGGSTMFLNEMDRPTVEDLIHGIIINSGNDACVVVAEGLAGSEETFAQKMTERAQTLGMTNSTFKNSSGWPAEGHRMSLHDLGILATRLITEFPEYYPYFGMTGFNYQDRAPSNANNRNPLLGLGVGADGLKTGHTQEAGYGLVGSAEQNGRRIVFVISGLASEAERRQEAEALTNWAFRQFVLRTLAKGGSRLAEAEVHMGAAETVGLVVEKDLTLLLPALALAQEGIKAEAVYNGPISAPIAAGQVLGELVLDLPEMEDIRVPLVAEADVPVGGFGKHLSVATGALMARVSGS